MRLIDADKFKAYMQDKFMFFDPVDIDAQPTVDAEPVVHCKDCKWWGGGFCVNLKGFGAEEDDYCSWGERRTDEID